MHSAHGILDCAMLFNQWLHNYMHYQLGYLLGSHYWAILWASIHPSQNSYIWMQDFLEAKFTSNFLWFGHEFWGRETLLTYSPSAEMSQHCKEFLFWSIQPWRTLHYWTLWSQLTRILCSGSAITLQRATYAMIELSSWENLFLPSTKLDQQPECWLQL